MADPGRKHNYLVTHYPGDDVLQKYQISVYQLLEMAVDHIKRNMGKYSEEFSAIMGSCNLPEPTSTTNYKVWRRWSWLLSMPPHQALDHFFMTLESCWFRKNAIVGSAPEHGRSLPGMQ
ncbi:uncharacterized protein [Coffea arabica]|uniref:Uncharacterized protein isoform X1 n=1 Tax=Coffea arabica TaxID=13443 RepID=A0ABM4URR7_COFAR